MLRISGLALVAAIGLGACATEPTFTKTSTTLGEVDMTGLVCRNDKPITSNRPQSVCATPQAWAAYDKKQREQSDIFFEEQIKKAPTDAFRGRRD